MKMLQKFEKRKETWLLFLLVLLFCLSRLPSLIEPVWYGDEGIYEVIGLALDRGRLLYAQIWDNKPPLLYMIYAFAHADQFIVRFLSLLAGALSVIFFYYLAKRLFAATKLSIIATVVYALLFATPFLEGNIANAENFMLLPIVVAAFLVYKSVETSSLSLQDHEVGKQSLKSRGLPRSLWSLATTPFFSAGFLLGLAFLLKIVALFDFAAFFVFLACIFVPARLTLRHHEKIYIELLKKYVLFIFGFLLPILLTVLYFLARHALSDFIHATFFGNIGYVNYANTFIIPQGFLILKLCLLLIVVGLVFWKKNSLPRSAMFIFLWFVFSLFNATFSGRPWTHYMLVLVPSAALLIGLLFDNKAKKLRIVTLLSLIFLVYLAYAFFKVSLKGTLPYYANYIQFVTNHKSTLAYQEYFDSKVPRDYEVAQFIRMNTKPEDNVFIWGNNPQIYVLADKLPPGKYTVEYHITQSKGGLDETSRDIARANPKYVIILSEMHNFPYSMNKYVNKYSLKGAEIYERTF